MPQPPATLQGAFGCACADERVPCGMGKRPPEGTGILLSADAYALSHT